MSSGHTVGGDINRPGARNAHWSPLVLVAMLRGMEDLGREILRRARCREDAPEPGGAVAVAAQLYGGDCIVESARAQTEAELARWQGRTLIVMRKRLSVRRAHFAVARMIARRELEREGIKGDEGLLAAFIVAPTPAVRRCVASAGLDVHMVADAFAVTQTCAAMRLGEVGETEGVVVTPERVYRRGLGWVSDDDARRLAMARPRSLAKVALDDEPGRIALFRRAG